MVAAVAAAVIIQTAEKLQQNAQASGDDTQEQMSTKVILLSTVIDDMTGGAEELFSTFELAPGSEPIQGDDLAYTVICDDGAGTLHSMMVTSVEQLLTMETAKQSLLLSSH